MGPLELCGLLDCRLLQHQHMDDFVVHDCRGALMVAVMAVRVDRLCHRWLLCVLDRSHRCHVSHRLPGCGQIQLWYLGQPLACLQPRRHGLCVVRRPVVDWRTLCLLDDPSHLALVGKSAAYCVGIRGSDPVQVLTWFLNSQDRNTIPNTFAEGSGATSADYVSFFIFWFCSLPAIWFPVHKIRHLFTVKAYFVPCAGIAFFIWAIVRAGGVGPIIRQPSKIVSMRDQSTTIAGLIGTPIARE